MGREPEVAIVGVAYSPVARRSSTTAGRLAVSSCLDAIKDAGLTVEDIDGVANYPSPSRIGAGTVDGVDFVSVAHIAQALQLRDVRWHTSLTRGSLTGSVAEAANAIAAGACDYALAYRAMHNPPGRFGRPAPGPASGEEQFIAPYGFTNEVVKWSIPCARYMAKYGATRRDLARLVVQARTNAAANPQAVFYEQPLSTDEYLDARMIVDPVCLYDCDMPVDVSSAVVLTSGERARELRPDPVYLWAAVNHGFPPKRRPTYVLEDHVEAMRRMADTTLAAAGVGPNDVTHLQLYDGFSFHIWFALEAFGFCGEGDAHGFVAPERTGRWGTLPLNTSGGSIGMGRLHGGAQVVEAVLQAQRRVGDRQIADPGLGLVTAGAAITGAGALVVSTERRAA